MQWEPKPAKDAQDLPLPIDQFAVGQIRDGEIFYIHVYPLSPLSGAYAYVFEIFFLRCILVALIVVAILVIVIFISFYLFPVVSNRLFGWSGYPSGHQTISWSTRFCNRRVKIIPSNSQTTTAPSSQPQSGMGISPSLAHFDALSSSTEPPTLSISTMAPENFLRPPSRDAGGEFCRISASSLIVIPANSEGRGTRSRSSPRKQAASHGDVEAQHISIFSS